MPNNREWSLLSWATLLLAWAMFKPEFRKALLGVLQAAFTLQFVVPLIVMVLWVGLESWLAAMVVPWNKELTKGAIVWFLTAGIVLFVGFEKASKDPRFFRRKALDLLAWSAFLEFYFDIYHLPFLGELVIQPLLFAIGVMIVLAGKDEKHQHAKSCLEGILALLSVGILAYVSVRIARGWNELVGTNLLLQFALPAWLTLGALPFIFLLALYASYESAFSRINLQGNTSLWKRVRAKLALAIGSNIQLHAISDMPGYELRKLTDAPSFRSAYATVREYRISKKQESRKQAERKAKLKRYAEVKGVDSGGLQLDQREFEDTADALRWLGTCMMGWHERSGHYRSDILVVIGDGFDRFGLVPLDVEIKVSADGQAWFAWRRTITGWCFAIGAAKPPPDQWEYDGKEPPSGFPGKSSEWGHSPYSETNPNW